MRYTIYNPTTARRIIYDGIEGSQKKIQIGPLETKTDVELADHIAAGFGDGKNGDKRDLWVTPLVGGFTHVEVEAIDEKFVTSLPSDTHSANSVAYQTAYPTMMKPSEDPVPLPPPPPTLPEGYQRYQAPPIEEKPKKQRKKRNG